ncbi:MAG TPA: glycosyltransferase family A protein [Actinomycetota bacterium]|nr:glycosyltransferase family A protein [Actinomycetota bacterium]
MDGFGAAGVGVADQMPPASVTVVVPCFEQAQYLTACLESVRAQTLQPGEVIVVDDGSRLEHSEEIQQIARIHNCGYVRVTNRHLAAARNTGLMLAEEDAFLPLDADDTIEPTFIEKTYRLLSNHDVVCVGLQEHGERNGCYNPGFDIPLEEVTEERMWEMNRLFYCCLFNTELLRKCGGYNPRMVHGWEDYDLHLDLIRRGARYTAVNEPLFNYRTSNDGMMAAAARDHRAWNIAEMRRHHLG